MNFYALLPSFLITLILTSIPLLSYSQNSLLNQEHEASINNELPTFSPYYDFKTPHFASSRKKYIFESHNDYQNEIHVFQRPQEAFTTKVKALLMAKESIHIQYLDIKGDESNALIAEILKIKADEGINIQIIVDAVHSYIKCKPKSNCASLLEDLQKYPNIKVYGIADSKIKHLVQEMNYKPVSYNKRLHEKTIIIDGLTDHGFVIMGGTNISNKFAQIHTSPKLKWWDQDLILKGPIVQEIEKSYLWNLAYYASQTDKWWKGPLPKMAPKNLWHQEWNHEKWGPIVGEQKEVLQNRIEKLLKSHRRFGKVVKSQNPLFVKMTKKLLNEAKEISDLEFFKAPMRYFQHRPKAHEKIIYDLYLKMIQESKKEIIIANSYMILSPNLKKALKDAAKRGVKVHLISNSSESTDSSETVHYFEQQQYDLLRTNLHKSTKESGGEIKISVWKGRKIGLGTMHSKIALFDGNNAIIGSYNFDYRSQLFNTENALLFYGEAAEKAHEILLTEYYPRIEEVSFEEAKQRFNASIPKQIRNGLVDPFKYFF